MTTRKHLLTCAAVALVTACDPNAFISRAGKAAQEAAKAIDPFKINDRVDVELELARSKERSTPFQETSGVDAAVMTLGPFPEGIEVLIEAQNTVLGGGDVESTVNVYFSTAAISDSVLLSAGLRGTSTVVARTAAILTFQPNQKVVLKALGSNKKGSSRQVTLKAYKILPPGK